MPAEQREQKKNPSPQDLNTPSKRDAAATTAAARVAGPPRAAADDPTRFGKEDCCVREFWAVVETDGTLVRGRNVWRVAKLATGVYEVIFTGDVSQGVFVATIGRPEYATEPTGEITVALRCCLSSPETNKGVWVDTHDSTGAFADRAFHLLVHV